MKMQLSSTRKELLYAQFKLSRYYFVNLPKIRSAFFGLTKDDYLAMIIVSLVSSMLMMCSLRFIKQLQKNYEYSWKKNTSHSNLEKLSTIFFTFRYQFKKESSQKGLWVFRYISGSLLRAYSIVSTLQTYFSIVWQAIKSYNLVASFYELWHYRFAFFLSTSNTSSHFFSNSVRLRNLPFSMPTSTLNMGEQRPTLTLRSILPISHLNFSLVKVGIYFGISKQKMLLMSFSWFSNYSQQNSNGLFMIPQQLRVATVSVLFNSISVGILVSPVLMQPIQKDYITTKKIISNTPAFITAKSCSTVLLKSTICLNYETENKNSIFSFFQNESPMIKVIFCDRTNQRSI